MEQYKKGERFVRGDRRRARAGGADAAVGRPGDAAARRRDRGTRSAGSRGSWTAARPHERTRDRRRPAAPGPGSGPGGAPTAIALSPILSARYRSRDLERIRAAAPGAASSPSRSRASPTARSTTSRSCSAAGSLRTRSTGSSPARRASRWVHSATSGVERALTPAARERGLVVTNARGVFSRPIAEYVLMMILAVSRRLPQLLELQRERTWQPLEGAELRDVTVGIVGLGSIGRAVGGARDGVRLPGRRASAADAGGRAGAADRRGRRARPLGELMLDRVGGPETLPELLAESDFIVLAAPLTPETEEMINDDDARAGQARRVADQRRPRPARSTSARCSARCATARSAAPSSTRSATSRCRRCRRSTTCPTSSSRRTRPGRAAASSTGASSCSATTCAGSRPASRCSTWSTRAPGTDPRRRRPRTRRMQIAIVGLAGIGQDDRLQHAHPRPRRDRRLRRRHAQRRRRQGPDARLDRLAEIFKPKKIVHADVTYVDLPAPPPSTEGHVGTEELPADHLARLRDSDALLHVVRAFEDPAHPHPDGQRRPGARPRAARPRVHPGRPRR